MLSPLADPSLYTSSFDVTNPSIQSIHQSNRQAASASGHRSNEASEQGGVLH